MFPSGRAGLALLLLRTSIASAPLLAASRARSWSNPGGEPPWILVVHWIVAPMLLLGYLTPIMALISLVLTAITMGEPTGSGVSQAVIFILNAGALALMGPGAYSLDGRWFGRRVVRIPKG